MIDVDYNEYKETLAENMKLIVENHRLEEVEKEHQKLNGELREEIERLLNIIDELEKSININLKEFEDNKDYFIDETTLKDLKNELQELKGSNNNG